jgi:hypothetical protein
MRFAALLAVAGSSLALAEAPVPPDWREGKSLGDKTRLEDARVCADAQGHVLVFDSDGWLYYGDAKELSVVAMLHDRTVVDPRLPGGQAAVRFDAETQGCQVTCGERTVTLPRLEQAPAAALLLSARYLPSPMRTPHALLRDAKGAYYYVERGRAKGEERNFRLYVGPRGAMVLQKMVNVVSDSAGDLFTTKSGDLRLLVDREKSSEWVARGKRTPLRLVPIDENLRVIFTELGVYSGQRLGTPCDDL